MSLKRLRSGMLLSAMVLVLGPVYAQTTSPQSASGASAAASQPGAKTFSQQDLDRLLAPIALYPDALLAQIFMASTYPLEVVEAARWIKANPKLSGKALEDALQKQRWDPAVKSLTAVPQVLEQMDSKLDWTQQLGDAFLAQQKDVMATVQSLRAKASANGNLKSTEQQVVKSDVQGGQTTYIIESPKPDVVYVPTYNPTVVYGSWWYPVPPYTVYPPAYVYPPGLAFATGVFVGAAIWGGCNWWRGDIDVNVNHYNNFNRTNIENKNWQHNVDHRRGVAYSDNSVAQKYNRSGSADAVKARENYRGRAEGGRGELQTMDRQSLNDQVRQSDRVSNEMRGSGERGAGSRGEIDRGFSPDTANRQRPDGAGNASRGDIDRGASDAGNRQRGSGDRSPGVSDRAGGGFSGVSGGGGATREASQRGMSSRGGGAPSGARAGGGGGRGGRR